MSNSADAKRVEAMTDRLDRVEDEIEEARRDAEQVTRKEPKESFAQKGTVDREHVDDAIVPPG